ncbi:MAG: phosphoenolpyruvate--protein phosphotransferase [Elusimicrobia bacterium]|nr:phosphoenolpyruvate--protein phosphotransferase [Elusimicrobiota bacterium]
MIVIKGVPASPGIAIGKAYVLEDEEIIVNKTEIPKGKLRMEVKRFKAALDATYRDLDHAEQKVLKTLGRQHAKLIDTHRLILSDPLITKDVPRRIESEQVNAEFALSEALETVNQTFEKIEDEFFRERRHDLFDVGKRLLSHLLKREKRDLTTIDAPAILIARNLLPSDTINLKETKILGFATDLGGKSSHTAILAQSMEIPAVVGLSDVTHRVKTGDTVVLDGDHGLVIVSPTPEAVTKYQKEQKKSIREEKALDTLRGQPAVTTDGKHFQMGVNLDVPEELKTVLALKPDGIGLFRTEALFLNRTEPPSESEQVRAYTHVAKSMAPHTVVIRVADMGGDRLVQLGIDAPKDEANPFMGLRGIRLLLRHPDLFKTQLRAILRSCAYGNVRILLPMISSMSELRASRQLFATAQQELLAEGVELPKKIEMGIMVEIPSAALLLDHLLTEADFISIGTNDLIQYLLAVDRINEHVAHLYDPFHPTVVRVLSQIVETAHRHGKWVSVCGEMTSDPRAVPLLVGMGVNMLSVSPRMFLRVKQIVMSLSTASAAQFVSKALTLADSEDIQRLLNDLLDAGALPGHGPAADGHEPS